MKRIGNIYPHICSVANLQLADAKARKGKKRQPGVIAFDKNRESNILAIHNELVNKTYRISEYTTFKVYEPKERLVYRLPYKDRVIQHAVLNDLERVFVSTFTADTYSCIKGKGIHAAAKGVKRALRDRCNTQFCLKLDIKKFYPSVDHDILKLLLRRKIKDNDLLSLLDGIIDSADGLPIGNYLSQYFANFYLTYFDHWLKEVKKVKYYFRYADDIVILHSDKAYLHSLLAEMREYLQNELKLTIKGNYQIFPVAARGIDFVGYVFFHTHTLLRKGIKKRFARMMKLNPNPASLASYRGWAVHCNSYNLLNKLTNANKEVQRLKYHDSARKRGIHRQKERHGRYPRSGNTYTRLQDSSIEVS